MAKRWNNIPKSDHGIRTPDLCCSPRCTCLQSPIQIVFKILREVRLQLEIIEHVWAWVFWIRVITRGLQIKKNNLDWSIRSHDSINAKNDLKFWRSCDVIDAFSVCFLFLKRPNFFISFGKDPFQVSDFDRNLKRIGSAWSDPYLECSGKNGLMMIGPSQKPVATVKWNPIIRQRLETWK